MMIEKSVFLSLCWRKDDGNNFFLLLIIINISLNINILFFYYFFVSYTTTRHPPRTTITTYLYIPKRVNFILIIILVNNDIIRSYKKYNVVPSAILLLSTTRASRQHHHGMETRPALQHSCRNQRYNYYEKSKGQYITADIRNMADEEEQPSVEEVAQQQPEEKVALEVKVGKFQFADGSWYEGEYVVDGATSKRQGNGFLQDGEESYEGNWENDTMNGEGVYSFPRVRHIPALLKMGSLKVKANISGWMVQYILATGTRIKCMEQAHLSTQKR